jgi:hypothetical protein
MAEGLRGFFQAVDAEPSAEFTEALLASLRTEFEADESANGRRTVDHPVADDYEEAVVTLTVIDEQRDEGEPTSSRRKRRWWLPVAAAAAVAAVIAAGVVANRGGDERHVDVIDDVPRSLAPTPQRLDGVWYEDRDTGSYPEPIIARFEADGTFAIGGLLDDELRHVGTYETDGYQIVMSLAGGACGSEAVWTWDAAVFSTGRLEAVNAGTDGANPDLVGECTIPVGEPFNFTRISPTSPAAADITPGDPLVEGPISNETTTVDDLQGYWLQPEGAGYLLRFDSQGGYRIDDAGDFANPGGAGRVEIGTRTLTLTTGADATGCSEGDVWAWTNVRVDAGTLRATVTHDDCGRTEGGELAFIYLHVDTTP